MAFPDGRTSTYSASPHPQAGLPLSVVVAWAAAIAFVCFLSGIFYYSRLSVERHIREQTVAVAQMVADRVALAFDNTDRLLLSIADDLEPSDYDATSPMPAVRRSHLQTLLARSQMQHRDIHSLTLANAEGRLVVQVADAGGRTPPDTREPVGFAQDDPAATVLLAVAQDPESGAWRAHMARRVADAAGRPLGLLAAQIDLEDSFATFAQLPVFEPTDLIALRDTVSGVLLSYPANNAPAGTLGEFPIKGAVAGEALGGLYYAQSAADDSRRLVAYRRVPGYPQYVAYGKGMEELLATWRREALAIVLAALLALATTAIVTAGIRRRVMLATQLEEVRRHLEESNNALRVALAASELVAARDQLTGLWNRRSFDQRMQETIAHLARHDGTLSLLMIDIDHFKNINDRHGHLTGDEVLKWFADVLQERLRQNDVHARWGGEEFTILADGANLDNACLLAEQIRQTVETRQFGNLPRLTVSIGVAEYRRGETSDDLLIRADDALYNAKRAGRNRVVAADYDPAGQVSRSLFEDADLPTPSRTVVDPLSFRTPD